MQRAAQRKRSICLSDPLAEYAKIIGGGSVSEGIRIALESMRKDSP